eukprot:1194331-Prorocentrum_minimum.AAC.4
MTNNNQITNGPKRGRRRRDFSPLSSSGLTKIYKQSVSRVAYLGVSVVSMTTYTSGREPLLMLYIRNQRRPYSDAPSASQFSAKARSKECVGPSGKSMRIAFSQHIESVSCMRQALDRSIST